MQSVVEIPTKDNSSPPVPLWIRPTSIWTIGQQLISHPWQIGLLAAGAMALLIRPQILTVIAAVLMSLVFGWFHRVLTRESQYIPAFKSHLLRLFYWFFLYYSLPGIFGFKVLSGILTK